MKKTKKANQLSFDMTNENFDFFIRKVNDIVKIYGSEKEKPLMITIDKDNILMYGLVGQGQNIQAFSSFVFKTDEFIQNFNAEFEKTKEYKCIVTDGKYLFGKAFNFVSLGESVTIDMSYNEDYYVELMTITSHSKSEFKFDFIGSPRMAFPIQINTEVVENAMKLDKSEFNFKLSKIDFDRIKKIAITGAENDVYYVNVKDGKVRFGENRWDFIIDEIELDDLEDPVLLPKKYFHSLTFDNKDSDVTFYVFDIFLLAKSEKTNLFMSRETIIK